MLAFTSPTGKLGNATLNALLSLPAVQAKDIVLVTSSPLDSDRVVAAIGKREFHDVRRANYADQASMTKAFSGCDRLFFSSTPDISLDFNDAPPGKGREAQHFNVLNAAIDAGIQHVYYTSLAFQDGAQAGVMRAHFRTEDFLRSQSTLTYTILREGLYNESWPLYLGHFGGKEDERKEIIVAGDGPISWTSIADLGYATARVIADRPFDDNKTVFLSQKKSVTLKEIAEALSRTIKIVDEDEYVRYYHEDRGMDKAMLEWWVSTYHDVVAGRCQIDESPLEDLLNSPPQSFFDSLMATFR